MITKEQQNLCTPSTYQPFEKLNLVTRFFNQKLHKTTTTSLLQKCHLFILQFMHPFPAQRLHTRM